MKIAGQFNIALLDTGCGTSIISHKFLRKNNLQMTNLKRGQNYVLFAANGSKLRVLGQTTILLNLGGMNVSFDFLVVDSLNQDMILGIDFLEHTKAKIICAEQKVIFYDDLIQVNMINRQRDVLACVSRNYILEPKTETLVTVYLSEPVYGQTVMMEQVGVRDKQKYLVAKAIVEPEGKYTVCKILNASDNKIMLRKHVKVGRLQDIDVNSITEY